MTTWRMTDLHDDEPQIAPLTGGEERLLQTVHRADGNRNDIYLVHRRPSDDEASGTGEPANFVAVIRSTDQDPSDTSPPWAWQRGPTERSICIALAEAIVNAPPLPGTSVSLYPHVQWFADRIRENSGPTVSATETAANWAQLYVTACGEVLTAANACLEVTNRAVGARGMIAERQNDGLPGTPIAIRNFTGMAEKAEREFAPLYSSFDAAYTTARDAAAQLLAAQSDPIFSEMLLAATVGEDMLDNVATVKGILGATFGPTPPPFSRASTKQIRLCRIPRTTATSTDPVLLGRPAALFSPMRLRPSRTNECAHGAPRRSKPPQSYVGSVAATYRCGRTRRSRPAVTRCWMTTLMRFEYQYSTTRRRGDGLNCGEMGAVVRGRMRGGARSCPGVW